jgi:hypothetical protein
LRRELYNHQVKYDDAERKLQAIEEGLDRRLRERCDRHEGVSRKEVWEGDDCAVCLEALMQSGHEGRAQDAGGASLGEEAEDEDEVKELMWYKGSCGQNLHRGYLEEWIREKRICPLCGEEWASFEFACD